ncbi:MAG: CSLREA domain-containing protein [Candidatus Promineifilaceae bacterium]
MEKRSAILLVLFLALALPWWVLRVMAAPTAVTRYVATTGADSGDCTNAANPCATLTYAVQQTNVGDTVEVASGWYTETDTINILRDVTIRGAGLDKTTVSVPADPNIWRVFLIYGGVTAEISHMTIRNAERSNIYNIGNLTLRHVNVTEGRGVLSGGGIYNVGQLTVEDSYIADNQAIGGSVAAGLLNAGTAVIRRAAFVANEAVDNYGGGLHNQGHLTLENVTFAYNKAKYATAISNSNRFITMTHVTIVDNINSTPASTNASAVLNYGSLAVVNTIIANNLSGTGSANGQCAGPLTSQGHNISSDSSCGFTQPSDMPNTDPQMLGTWVLVTGTPNWISALEFAQSSPALDAADAASCPATDARGVPRPIGSGCDIGAYEFNNYRAFLPAILVP